MPSNLHENLLRQLKDITSRVKDALGENDLTGLPEMIKAHQEIMRRLDQAGDCEKPELLDLLTETNAEVQAVIQKIAARQAEIHDQMKTMANKKNLVRAYGV